MSIKDNILNIKEEISDQVKLVAVSKTRSIDEIKEAYNSNQKIFGENRVQEIVEKQQQKAIKISGNKLSFELPVISVPFFLISYWHKLWKYKADC